MSRSKDAPLAPTSIGGDAAMSVIQIELIDASGRRVTDATVVAEGAEIRHGALGYVAIPRMGGTALVEARKEGYAVSRARIDYNARREGHLVIVMTKSDSEWMELVDESGAAAASVEIKIVWGSHYYMYMVSDPKGRVPLPCNSQELRCVWALGTRTDAGIDAEFCAKTEIVSRRPARVLLHRNARLSLTLDSAGPLSETASVFIELKSGTPEATPLVADVVVDQAGNLSVPYDAVGVADVEVHCGNMSGIAKAVELQRDGAGPVIIHLGEARVLHGRVESARGEPILGAAIQYLVPEMTLSRGAAESERWDRVRVSAGTCRSAADGSYVLLARNCGVLVFHPDYLPKMVSREELAETGSHIVLEDGASLDVRILWPSSPTISGTLVVDRINTPSGRLGTEARAIRLVGNEGVVSFKGLRPGSLWMSLRVEQLVLSLGIVEVEDGSGRQERLVDLSNASRIQLMIDAGSFLIEDVILKSEVSQGETEQSLVRSPEGGWEGMSTWTGRVSVLAMAGSGLTFTKIGEIDLPARERLSLLCKSGEIDVATSGVDVGSKRICVAVCGTSVKEFPIYLQQLKDGEETKRVGVPMGRWIVQLIDNGAAHRVIDEAEVAIDVENEVVPVTLGR